MNLNSLINGRRYCTVILHCGVYWTTITAAYCPVQLQPLQRSRIAAVLTVRKTHSLLSSMTDRRFEVGARFLSTRSVSWPIGARDETRAVWYRISDDRTYSSPHLFQCRSFHNSTHTYLSPSIQLSRLYLDLHIVHVWQIKYVSVGPSYIVVS